MDPSERHADAPAWAERLTAALLLAVPVAALAFVCLFVLDPNTQLLGLALGATLALTACALVLAGRWLVPQETKVEQRPRLADPDATHEVVERTGAGVEGITRRRLLASAAGVAGAGLTAAVVIPVVALGPGLEEQLRRTPWRAGRALVNEQGKPMLAADIVERSFQTAFPKGADQEDLGSPVVVVRVNPATLKLSVERAGWAPEGILAYSKICTHAACAISLFRDPLSPSTESRGPALVCPCHYSTFDVLDGGSVEFGPAGRPLPQLPLQIDATGALRAAGPMSGPVGPSWWGRLEVSRSDGGGRSVDAVAFVDERLGAARGMRWLMDYVFPDHWSFLLGEIALYSFVVLILTGTFLALFFDADTTQAVYHGSYQALQGQSVSDAYASTLHLSFNVSGGLLVRQVHHWAALVFVAAITLHLLRIVFTGAFRKPRDVNYFIGVTLLALAILEGFAGYSLPDDLLSGMGLAIAWAVAMSLPLIGGPFATALWGGRFPGSTAFESRLFIAHVFIVPAILGALIAVHLAIIMRQRHSQFPGPGRREENVVGTPMWPGYALRSLGLFAAVTALLVLMGGLIQINPVWLWGPYHPYIGTNGAQPDWYLGWLIGALRLMPNLEIHVFGHTLVPNPFFGGVLFPGLVFGLLYALPWLDRRFISKDYRRHDLLERPRDNPRRSALAAAVLSAVAVVFAAGSADRLFFQFGFGYEGSVWFFRGAFLIVPVIVFAVTKRVCVGLAREGAHPLRGWSGQVVVRTERGGFDADRS